MLDIICRSYKKILKDKLVGIYIHGSAAFGCFRWNTSDLDFLVVVSKPLLPEEKMALIKVLLDLENVSPKKGLEMSVVLEEYCRTFVYSTPYELHFSNAHKAGYKADLAGYCEKMHGTDEDLAAHFTVTKAVGKVLCGKDIIDVFGDVPKAYYVDSIRKDIENAHAEIAQSPVYIILNLCRVLAYVQDGAILSKRDGGLWGIAHLTGEYRELIEAALKSYTLDKVFAMDVAAGEKFACDMLKQIDALCCAIK